MRLTHPHITPVAQPVGITFDGRPIPALPGETVAAALSAAGVLTYRHTRSGAPRGLWCGMGACFDCLVTVDGRANQRACLVKVAPGMVVGSAPPAAPAPLAPEPHDVAEEHRPDVLVVGAGPAGLAAAIAAAEAGCTVAVLDERDQPGGQYLKPLAAGHVHARPDRQFRLAAAMRARAEAAGVAIHVSATAWGAFALPEGSRSAAGEIAALVAGRNAVFRPRRLILAPGAHERPVPIPGWTTPGVMTTGALQTLARANRVSPGRRVVIAGNGPLNLQLACELLDGGVEVIAVLEAAPRPGVRAWRDALALLAASPDLAWDGARYLTRLRRAGVPVVWGATVAAVHPLPLHGRGRDPRRVVPKARLRHDAAWEGEGRAPFVEEGVEAVLSVSAVSHRGPLTLATDILALNHGFQPETGLARALGLDHRFADHGLGRLETSTDPEGRTSHPHVFAIGDGASLGGARVALARGRLAGLAAARDLRPATPDDPRTRRALRRAERFQAALWHLFVAPPFDVAAIADTTIVCRCEEVTAATLRAALAEGATTPGALKKATRAGMGRCGGRMCAATVARFCGAGAEPDWSAPRAPVKPVPALALAMEKPEWSEGPSYPPPPTSPSPAIAGEGRVGRASPFVRSTQTDLLVIGAGILGLCTALYAAREGLSVTLLDRGDPGQAASTANAGSLHVQLHAYDSAGDAEGPDSAAAQILSLGPASVALWRDIAREAGEPLAIRTEGGLMLAETPDQLRRLEAKAALESGFGVATHTLGVNELYARHPWLAAGFAGAAFCLEEGQMDPLRGLSAVLRLVRAAGVTILPRSPVLSLVKDGAAFLAATPAGPIRAGRVVNAGGPWAGVIAAMLDAPIPVRATVQQVIATEPAAADLLRPLVLHAGRHLSLKQGEAGHLILGGAWPGELDPQGRPRNLRASIEGNLWVARSVLPALAGLHVIRAWSGLNVAIPGPILGEDPRVPGLFHAVTYNGWTLGPVMGRLLAAALRGGKGPPGVFLPGRF